MAGAKQLAHGLARNDSLSTLSLAGNNIGEAGAAHVAQVNRPNPLYHRDD